MDELTQEKIAFDALMERQQECPYCNGRGYQYLDGGRVQWRCPDCDGTGLERQEEEEEEEDEDD